MSNSKTERRPCRCTAQTERVVLDREAERRSCRCATQTVPLLRAVDIAVRYAQQRVLDGVSLEVAPSDYIGVIGPNGAGKSTLLGVLLGLIVPEEGYVERYDGVVTSYLPQRFPGDHTGFPATVREIVATGCLNLALPRREVQARIDHWLQRLEIESLGGKLIGELSGGQLQRVLLARALVRRPHLLLLDEPTSALDAQTREQFYPMLDDINRDGTAIVLISHDADRICCHVKRILDLDRSVKFFGDIAAYDAYREGKQHVHVRG